MQNFQHITVLLNETVEAIVTDPAGIYIDGTYGRGGHSDLLLSKLAPEGSLLAFDRDPQAIESAKQHANDSRFAIVQQPFSTMADVCRERGISGQVAGIMLDIGVSSPQLDDADRGFSFMHDGPLDMRMDPTSGISAAEFVNTASIDEMTQVFRDYGEERHARRIAQFIEKARLEKPFTRTLQLAEVVAAGNPAWEKHKNPATRVFQAIRIHVNDELGELERALKGALSVLAPGGRLAVISFHSLEDRLVKNFFRDQARGEVLPRGVPVMGLPKGQTVKLASKAIKASDAELSVNPRSRSAVLRVAEKLAEAP